MSVVITNSRPAGTTTVATKVYAKVSSKAASLVPGVRGPAAGSKLLSALRSDHKLPSAEVEILGQTVVVRMEIGLRYPLDVQATCQMVMRRVSQELYESLGVESSQIDVEVSWLDVAGTSSQERMLK